MSAGILPAFCEIPGINVTLAGQPGADAMIYQEKDVRAAIEKATQP